jgi:hypothetical protein
MRVRRSKEIDFQGGKGIGEGFKGESTYCSMRVIRSGQKVVRFLFIGFKPS